MLVRRALLQRWQVEVLRVLKLYDCVLSVTHLVNLMLFDFQAATFEEFGLRKENTSII